MAKCHICGWPSMGGVCQPKPFRVPKRLTDKECRAVVWPVWQSTTTASAWRMWADGKGPVPLLRGLKVDNAAKRYLEAMGAPGCCTVDSPCNRHRGALRGRDWKTGRYL